MRHAVALSLVVLLSASPAHAEVSKGVIIAASIAGTVALAGVGVLGYGIYSLEHAPEERTVGLYHNRVSTMDTVVPIGAGMIVLGGVAVIFSTMIFKAPVRTRRVALAPSGLGIGGTF